MNTLWLILASLGGYLGLMLLVARFAARGGDNRTFFTADRRSAWYRVWPAMISAAMSGITFVSVPGSVATDGFSYLQMVAGFTVGQLVVAYWLVPLFYRLQLTSIYEYFDHRYGSTTHRTSGWLFLLSKLMMTALRLYLVAVVLQQLLFARLGVPFVLTALGMVAVVWGYTHRGGVGALIPVDWLKTVFMVGAVVATLWATLSVLGWSVDELWQRMGESPMARIWHFDDPASDRYFWKMFVAGVLLLVAMTGLDQELMQRNLACRSVRDAQRNILWTAASQIVVIALFLVLGWVLYGYAAQQGYALPLRGDELFPMMAFEGGLPRWIGVLFVLGFAAGSFSSGGSALTAMTTSVLFDVQRDRSTDDQKLRRRRQWVHAGLALGVWALLLIFDGWADESVINLLYKVAGYTYGPILGLFLFGQWSKRTVCDGWVWLPALLAPMLAALLQVVVRAVWGYTIGFEILLYNALLTMGGLWLISRRTIS
ncbi:MAG: sodium:solute symporter [Alistipes sp.]|nr:sodium:solute symporter [Alistipes sp.]